MGQRVNIKFLENFGKSFTVTFSQLGEVCSNEYLQRLVLFSDSRNYKKPSKTKTNPNLKNVSERFREIRC